MNDVTDIQMQLVAQGVVTIDELKRFKKKNRNNLEPVKTVPKKRVEKCTKKMKTLQPINEKSISNLLLKFNKKAI